MATVRSFRTVQREGDREVSRDVDFYNLDMVIALGFRVRSHAAVRFRQWAADKLEEYIAYYNGDMVIGAIISNTNFPCPEPSSTGIRKRRRVVVESTASRSMRLRRSSAIRSFC